MSIFTRNENLKSDDSVEYIHQDITGFTRKLKPGSGKNIWILGGREIIKEFLLNGLADELCSANSFL